MRLTSLLLCALLCPLAFAQGPVTYHDDFSGYAAGSDGSPTWDSDSPAWTVEDGKLLADSQSRSAILCTKSPRGRVQTIEVTLKLLRPSGESWKVAGIVLQDDERNYWHLALVQAPDGDGGRHFVELQECYDGAWLASSADKTRLTSLGGGQFDWEYNHPYRLKLELSRETLIGTISELDGTLRSKWGYKFDNPAVTQGTAGLDSGGFVAQFTDFAATVSEVLPARPVEKPVYAPCDTKGYAAIKSRATGFFRVEQIGGRWWLITPKGEAFYALGTDHANYNAHWCEKLAYAPYHRNCVAKYNDSQEAWAKSTGERLKSWNFNALGCGWSTGMKDQGLPRDEFISFGSGFSGLDNIAEKTTWTGFPNVFSPRWESYCDKRARSFCGRLAADPWIIGYFLDNELEWFGKNHKQWGLFDECLKKPAGHTAKTALLSFLKQRYPTIAAFNAAWGLKLPGWEAIEQGQEVLESSSAQANDDRMAFIHLIAERYFSVTNAAMKRHDKNHMNLGCRFAGWGPEGVMAIAGRYCDVFTVNFYGQVDLARGVSTDMPKQMAAYARECRRPMMITEWSFPAYDSGLPCEHGAGQRVATQAEKARCYEIYQTALMQFPFMVGSNYFMWVDEPALGISSTFPEDSNYGLVDVNDDPWVELTQMATRVNARVYEIHSGKTPELKLTLSGDGRTVSIANKGGVGASFALQTWVDGKEQSTRLTVAAGAKVERPTGLGKQPGGHTVAASADAERRLAETDRSDNSAVVQVYLPGAPWPSMPMLLARRIPVVVSNPSPTASADAVLVAPLARLGVPQQWAQPIVMAVDGKGETPAQVDGAGPAAELCFRVGSLAPYSSRTFMVYPRLVPGVSAPPALAAKVSENGFEVDTGAIVLTHEAKGADLLSAVRAGDLPLGRLIALMHQQLDQNLWVSADRTEEAKVYSGPVRFCADVTVACARGGSDTKTTAGEEGTYEARKAEPQAYRACYRLAAYPGQSWFSSQLLWVQNAASQPWRLAEYYHYALSAIGGTAADDQPARKLSGGVAGWENPKLGALYGYIPTAGSDLRAYFWRDPGPGAQHPDVSRKVDLVLKPGERYAEPQPTAIFFGCRGTAEQAQALATACRSSLVSDWRAFPAEKR